MDLDYLVELKINYKNCKNVGEFLGILAIEVSSLYYRLSRRVIQCHK